MKNKKIYRKGCNNTSISIINAWCLGTKQHHTTQKIIVRIKVMMMMMMMMV